LRCWEDPDQFEQAGTPGDNSDAGAEQLAEPMRDTEKNNTGIGYRPKMDYSFVCHRFEEHVHWHEIDMSVELNVTSNSV
jgi:hypothetical protein